MTLDQASALARFPLQALQREYPHVAVHLMNGPGDIRTPREMHPAFYGSYDWHSSVHGHWMLARLLRLFDLPESGEIRRILDEHFTTENIAGEVAYFEQPNRQSFERTYGWAWLLKLAQELRDLASEEPAVAGTWLANLRPLEDLIVRRYLDFLPKQNYPIRVGTHTNTAFGLAFAHDYAFAAGHQQLKELTEERATSYFGSDRDYPAHLEPGGNDFFSPSLMEADLMRRVLPAFDFQRWFEAFLPRLPDSLATPAVVRDREDPQLAHLDGLNLSRAWCFNGIAAAVEGSLRETLAEAGQRHAEVGLANVATGHYSGEHWLASFAVYLLTE